jgi:hypothetical protein
MSCFASNPFKPVRENTFEFCSCRVNRVIITASKVGFLAIAFQIQSTYKSQLSKKLRSGQHLKSTANRLQSINVVPLVLRCKIWEIQVAFFKMDFKNKFVAHGKIDFRHFAIVKKTVRKATWFYF